MLVRLYRISTHLLKPYSPARATEGLPDASDAGHHARCRFQRRATCVLRPTCTWGDGAVWRSERCEEQLCIITRLDLLWIASCLFIIINHF